MSVYFPFLWHVSKDIFHCNSWEQGIGEIDNSYLEHCFQCKSFSSSSMQVLFWGMLLHRNMMAEFFPICSMSWLFRMIVCVHNLGMIRLGNTRGTCYTKIICRTCVWCGCICTCSLKAAVTSLNFELLKVEQLDFVGSGEGSALYNY